MRFPVGTASVSDTTKGRQHREGLLANRMPLASSCYPKQGNIPHPDDRTLATGDSDGTLLIWPQDQDTDAMYVARMVRTAAAK